MAPFPHFGGHDSVGFRVQVLAPPLPFAGWDEAWRGIPSLPLPSASSVTLLFQSEHRVQVCPCLLSVPAWKLRTNPVTQDVFPDLQLSGSSCFDDTIWPGRKHYSCPFFWPERECKSLQGGLEQLRSSF